MKKFLWLIDQWNGGLSDSPRKGLPGAFRGGSKGLDYSSEPGILKAAQGVTKKSGSTITDLISWIEYDEANGNVYYYGEENIYKEEGTGFGTTWTSEHNISADTPNGQGLKLFNGYLYYRSATRLGRYDLDATWDDDWQTGLTDCTDWSPLHTFTNLLLCGHGRYIATVDDLGTYTAEALTLPPNMHVRHIFDNGTYAVILANPSDDIPYTLGHSYAFLWDGVSDQYNEVIRISGGIHGGFAIDNKMYFIVGQNISIQESYGGPARTISRLPNTRADDELEVFPGSLENWQGTLIFGLYARAISSSVGGNVINAGVYRFGSRGVYEPNTLNCEIPGSPWNDAGSGGWDAIDGSTERQITAIKQVGNQLRIAWRSKVGGTTTFGVDYLDEDNFLERAEYFSLIYDRESPYPKHPSRLVVELAEELSGTESIEVGLSPDPWSQVGFNMSNSEPHYRSFDDSDDDYTSGSTRLDFPLNLASPDKTDNPWRSHEMWLKLTLLPDTNTNVTPKVKRVWVEYTEDADQL